MTAPIGAAGHCHREKHFHPTLIIALWWELASGRHKSMPGGALKILKVSYVEPLQRR